MLAVSDQGLDAIASSRQPVLFLLTDAVQHLDLEAIPPDAGCGHLFGDLLDQHDVVGAKPETDRAAATVEQKPDRKANIARIHALTTGIGDRGRLVICALHQADRRIERP